MKQLSRLFFIFYAVLIGNAAAVPDDSDSFADTNAPAPEIVSISFSGNKTTNEDVLRMFLSNFGVSAGMPYDTLKVNEVKRKLLMTNLFYKVTIVALAQDDGMHLYIIVQEIFYWFPTGTIEHFQTTDGKDSWFRVTTGLSKLNFRGRMETVSLRVTGWEDRSLNLSWSKPLLPTMYSIGMGGGAAYYPELNYPRSRLVINGRLYVGKDFTVHTKGYCSIIPKYSIIDTLLNMPTSLQRIHEAITSVGWTTDYRNNNFDPVCGWYLWNEFRSNVFYSDDAIKYGEYNTDYRFYTPGFFERNRFACHMELTLRTGEGGPYRRLFAGGEGSVRGFARDELGMTDEMNNCAVISTEYRFPIVTIPAMEYIYEWLPLLNRFPEMKGLYYQIDGALIADGGLLWRQVTRPSTRNQNGEGIGAGLKVLFPTLRRSGCFDVVFPVYHQKLFSSPAVYLYLDSFY